MVQGPAICDLTKKFSNALNANYSDYRPRFPVTKPLLTFHLNYSILPLVLIARLNQGWSGLAFCREDSFIDFVWS